MDTIPENIPAEMTLKPDCNDPIEGSIGKISASKDGHMRRNSTGNIGIPYKSVKILSRYLATTRSSCHDNCKYGISQDFDMNVLGSRALKTIAQKHSRGYYHMGKTEVLEERKKKSPSNCHKPDSPRREKGDLYQQFSIPLQELVPRSKPTLSKLSIEDHSGSKESDVLVNQVTATCVQDLDGTSSNRKQTIRNVKEEKPNKFNGKKVSSRAAIPLSSLHSVKKGLTTRPVVTLTPKRPGKRSITPKTETLTPKRPGKRYIAPKAETFKTLKGVSHLKSDAPSKGPKPEILTTKTLTHARYKQEVFVPESSSTSQHQETNTEKRLMDTEAGKNKPTRGRIVRGNDKETPARKLNFRKGKVVENEDVMNPSRRLKFKQRSLSDTIVVDVEKIDSKFGRREVEGSCVNSGKENNNNKVSLKHKDGDEDKKDPQNLLNNMIEETANKLAETKKSKVKVLVGAFETVISLRDQKQASMVDGS